MPAPDNGTDGRKPISLSYAQGKSPSLLRRYARHFLVGFCIAVALLASLMIPVRRSLSWCDPVSGTLKLQTVWPLGFTTGPRYERSALESRLHAIDYKWTQTWQFMSDDEYTIWGHPVSFACSSAPPIYHLLPVIDVYAKAASPPELRRFADILQSGTVQQQRSAVDDATERAFGAMYPTTAP